MGRRMAHPPPRDPPLDAPWPLHCPARSPGASCLWCPAKRERAGPADPLLAPCSPGSSHVLLPDDGFLRAHVRPGHRAPRRAKAGRPTCPPSSWEPRGHGLPRGQTACACPAQRTEQRREGHLSSWHPGLGGRQRAALKVERGLARRSARGRTREPADLPGADREVARVWAGLQVAHRARQPSWPACSRRWCSWCCEP